MLLTEIVELNSGTPQFRVNESLSADAPTYFYYGQSELEDDLTGIESQGNGSRQVRTFDAVVTLRSDDLVFSLISGKAAIVKNFHDGYLFTQNYVRLSPTPSIDAGYLMFMLNEDADIKRQLLSTSQGSVTLKFTIRQISNLLLPSPLSLEKQRIIGSVYQNQLRLSALKKRVAILETTLLMEKLKETSKP